MLSAYLLFHIFILIGEARFDPCIPFTEIAAIPRQAYITQEFSQYEGSGGPNDTKITDTVYLFVNETSGRLSAVKVILQSDRESLCVYITNCCYDNVEYDNVRL